MLCENCYSKWENFENYIVKLRHNRERATNWRDAILTSNIPALRDFHIENSVEEVDATMIGITMIMWRKNLVKSSFYTFSSPTIL